MRIPSAAFRIVKEAAPHLLRRPVVGIVAAARTRDGRWLLVRRADSGGWSLPGGTVEWGETLKDAVVRELYEEAGARVEKLGPVVGVFSRPDRDPRFHAVTIVVGALVAEPTRGPDNPLEILEASLFSDTDLPGELSHGMGDMLRAAQTGDVQWE